MLDVLGSDYLRTAQAKGAHQAQDLLQARAAHRPHPADGLVRVLVRPAHLGATFTEKIFAWLGWRLVRRLDQRPGHQRGSGATTLFTAVLVLFSTFLADVMRVILDPRVRSS